MKRTVLVLVLVLALTFAFTASAFATTGKFFSYGQSYYKWTGGSIPADTFNGTVRQYVNGDITGELGDTYNVRLAYSVSTVGSNPDNPGAHANYLATTAKCGMCHSVHRAAGDGVKLLPTADATCAGCHTGGTAITAKSITWATLNPDYTYDDGAELNGPAGGGGGPHNDGADTLIEDGYWDGVGTPPVPSYEHGARYGCFTRRCHATNPHGANSSKYPIFAAKLLFNNSPEDDAEEYGSAVVGSYGGEDAVYDDLGATDAAVKRFIDANPTIMSEDADGNIFINGDAPDENETHALVAGLTCGRPSVGDDEIGNDECHAEAAYAIVDKGIKERRNHATYSQSGDTRTDNTGAELEGFGGNDNRDWKTGHVAGTFAVGDSEYAPINGCTSCHDQTDSANTVAGNFTFPHGQTATGDTNIYRPDGATMATGDRVRIWAGYSGSLEETLTNFESNYSNQKAFDGQCLKCHRDGAGNGVGLTY